MGGVASAGGVVDGGGEDALADGRATSLGAGRDTSDARGGDEHAATPTTNSGRSRRRALLSSAAPADARR